MSNFDLARVPPNDVETERALLGAMLLTPVAVEDVRNLLTPDDFYVAAHQTLFAAMLGQFHDAEPIDAVTISERLKRDALLDTVGGIEALVDLQSSTPAATNAKKYAQIIVDLSIARRALAVYASATARVFDHDDPIEVADDVITDLRLLGDEAAWGDVGITPLSEFAAESVAQEPWIVGGLLRRKWRLVLIAEEGAGKTVLLRQCAIAAAAGIHPMTGKRIPAIKSLIVDLENPKDQVLEVCQPMLRLADAVSPTWDRKRCMMMHEEGGLDLRRRSGRSKLIAAVQQHRPDLVVIGPVYRMSKRGADSYEEDAGEVQEFLDDVRVRYDFALMIEHHQPAAREHLTPKGSVLWRHWPDLGLGLVRKKGESDAYTLQRYRGDRVRNGWPRTIYRSSHGLGSPAHSGEWPWRMSDHSATAVADLSNSALDDAMDAPETPPLPYRD